MGDENVSASGKCSSIMRGSGMSGSTGKAASTNATTTATLGKNYMGSEEVRITSDATTSAREKDIRSKSKEVKTEGIDERIPGGNIHISVDESFGYDDSSDDADWKDEGDDGVDISDGSVQDEEVVEVEGIGREDERDSSDKLSEYSCDDGKRNEDQKVEFVVGESGNDSLGGSTAGVGIIGFLMESWNQLLV
ncbi:hypothetical protein NE237_000113 [Protea cynaroides]|uniref:Uncharacterized protein n=1 Tax=Protea cynaroides TaxID=273540 RepID=A0A9Q0GKX6_9MAGN|nr:hypothetical protein NE237_000113 [Protea cynaroides]